LPLPLGIILIFYAEQQRATFGVRQGDNGGDKVSIWQALQIAFKLDRERFSLPEHCFQFVFIDIHLWSLLEDDPYLAGFLSFGDLIQVVFKPFSHLRRGDR
jgi:hypothetical protein